VRTEGLAGDELTQRSSRSQPPVPPSLPREPLQDPEGPGRGRCADGTISYLPPLFGTMLSGAVILDLLGDPGSVARRRP
jgi:hypothetical protein